MISKQFEMCNCAVLLYGGVVGGVGGNANDAAMGVIEWKDCGSAILDSRVESNIGIDVDG